MLFSMRWLGRAVLFLWLRTTLFTLLPVSVICVIYLPWSVVSDFRINADCGAAGGTPHGYALMESLVQNPDMPRGAIQLSDRRGMELALGLKSGDLVDAGSNEIIWRVKTEYADPFGVNGPFPMIANTMRVGNENRNFDPAVHTTSLARIQNIYENIRQTDLTQARKHATWMIEKYGKDLRTDEQKLDGTLPHSSVQGPDSFPQADSQLDADSDWTTIDGSGASFNVVSNELQFTTQTQGACRFVGSPSLTGNDHFSQAEVVGQAGSIWAGGLAARVNAGGDGGDYYYLEMTHHFSTGDTWQIAKVIDGTKSDIGTGSTSDTETTPFTAKLDCTGDTITIYKDDNQEQQALTETAI